MKKILFAILVHMNAAAVQAQSQPPIFPMNIHVGEFNDSTKVFRIHVLPNSAIGDKPFVVDNPAAIRNYSRINNDASTVEGVKKHFLVYLDGSIIKKVSYCLKIEINRKGNPKPIGEIVLYEASKN